jgi:hypothetical protein
MTPERIKEIEELVTMLREAAERGEKGDGYARIGNTRAFEAATALRQLLEERQWKPIESAPKDKEILALAREWEDGKRPILLRWFKYNGLEAWRDFENESLNPTHYMLPHLPPEEGEGK